MKIALIEFVGCTGGSLQVLLLYGSTSSSDTLQQQKIPVQVSGFVSFVCRVRKIFNSKTIYLQYVPLPIFAYT